MSSPSQRARATLPLTGAAALAIALLGSTLGASRARAEDCACDLPAGWLDVVWESDGSDLETPDPHAVQLPFRARGPRHVEWCAGNGDPRCMPVDSDAPQTRVAVEAQAMLVVELADSSAPRYRLLAEASPPSPVADAAGPDGVRCALERPPR